MKTQEQLSNMTEQELTFELACLVFGDDNVYMTNFGKAGVSTGMDAGYISINDWSWLMPLAVEHGVSIVGPYKGEPNWNAFASIETDAFNESPQRAIAICLILKLQEIK